MIILIIFALFFGCSSNEALLHKIDRLERRLDKLEHPKEWIELEPELIILDAVEKLMFCPECEELGLRSSIFTGITITTLMNISEYWDEDGNYHYDDPNQSTTEYSCSQGHNWAE